MAQFPLGRLSFQSSHPPATPNVRRDRAVSGSTRHDTKYLYRWSISSGSYSLFAISISLHLLADVLLDGWPAPYVQPGGHLSEWLMHSGEASVFTCGSTPAQHSTQDLNRGEWLEIAYPVSEYGQR